MNSTYVRKNLFAAEKVGFKSVTQVQKALKKFSIFKHGHILFERGQLYMELEIKLLIS